MVLAGYGLVEAWPLIVGPTLYINSPADNTMYADGIVSLNGHTKRATSIRINELSVLQDQNGDFSSTLTFPRGGSILTFVVTDRFGRTVTATRSIFVP